MESNLKTCEIHVICARITFASLQMIFLVRIPYKPAVWLANAAQALSRLHSLTSGGHLHLTKLNVFSIVRRKLRYNNSIRNSPLKRSGLRIFVLNRHLSAGICMFLLAPKLPPFAHISAPLALGVEGGASPTYSMNYEKKKATASSRLISPCLKAGALRRGW